MSKLTKQIFGAALVLGSMALAPSAYAQATRTWVSGVGDDANPCSRTAPCKTFAGTISKTAAGGEINCLDPGGWGAVSITKSITIDCSQFPGSILNAGTTGIIVNAATTDVVVIRGLEISGSTGSKGINGIRVLQVGSLTLENVIVREQSTYGLSFQPTNTAELVVINSTFTSSGNAGTTTGGGILIAPTGAGVAQATLWNTRAVTNAFNGVSIDTSGSTAAAGTNVIDLTLDGGTYSGNSYGIYVNTPSALARVMVVNTSVANNNRGIAMQTANSVVRVGNTTITGNTNRGVQVNGTPAAGFGIVSYNNNRLNGNNNDGTFSSTTPQQ